MLDRNLMQTVEALRSAASDLVLHCFGTVYIVWLQFTLFVNASVMELYA